MKTVFIFACTLLVSVSAVAFSGNNSGKKSKETISVGAVENVKVLQLTGSVVDDKNKETLAGAAVIVDGKKYYSDLDGQFTITGVNPGKYEVKVELISYESYTTEIDLTKSRKLDVSLQQK